MLKIKTILKFARVYCYTVPTPACVAVVSNWITL